MRIFNLFALFAIGFAQIAIAQTVRPDVPVKGDDKPSFIAPAVQPKPTGRYIGLLSVLDGTDFVTNRENAAFARLTAIMSKNRITNYRRIGSSRSVVFEAPNRDILRTLQADRIFTSIVEDQLNYPTLNSANALIGTPILHGAPGQGDGQVVVVIDTGVDSTHPFLSGRVVDGACFSSNDLTYGSTSLCAGAATTAFGIAAGGNCQASIKGCDHGTHVAGIAAGVGGPSGLTGLSPQARIVAIQVFSKFPHQPDPGLPLECQSLGGCAYAFDSDILAGLDHVNTQISAQYPVSSVNMSLGGGKHTATCTASVFIPNIQALRAKNIATVISSGNNGYGVTTLPPAVGSPGCVADAITVGSTTDLDALSNFSNISTQIDILAPGSSIYSSVPGGGYSNFSGTSMAAPIVAGAIASVNSYYEMPITTLEAKLEATGVPVTSSVGPLPRINFTTAKPSIDAAVPTGPFAWMRDTWNDFGQEPYGLFTSEVQYASPYIWIRSNPDGVANQHIHENPEFGQPNYAYVKIHNTGAASGAGTLHLYYADANVGNLSSPSGWTLISSAPMTLASHSGSVQEFVWSPPGSGHYCLLAFWVPLGGSSALPLNGDIGAAVLNERELVWRNVNVVNFKAPFFEAHVKTEVHKSPKIRLLVNVSERTPGIQTATRGAARLTISPPKGVKVSNFVETSRSGVIVDARANTISVPLQHGVYSMEFSTVLKSGTKLSFGMKLPTVDRKTDKRLSAMKILISDVSDDKKPTEYPKQGVVYTIE